MRPIRRGSLSKKKTKRGLTVAELAAERGVSVWTIRRWLHRLDRKAKGAVLDRDGKGSRAPLRTTLRALKKADRRLVKDAPRDELSELRAKCADDRRRMQTLERRLGEARAMILRLSSLLEARLKPKGEAPRRRQTEQLGAQEEVVEDCQPSQTLGAR